MNRYTVFNFLLTFSLAIRNPVVFMKLTNYYESIYVYFMSKRLDENKKKFINQWYVNLSKQWYF